MDSMWEQTMIATCASQYRQTAALPQLFCCAKFVEVLQ